MIFIYYISNLGYKLNVLDTIYNVIVNHTTVGYGDYLPNTNIGKIIVIFHILSVYLLNNIIL